MEDSVKVIIDAAVLAPSGDNSQPWEFSVDNSRIYLFNNPKKDDSLYNWDNSASYIALGASIQNMIIVGEVLGYEIDVSLFPDKENLNYVAKLDLIKKFPKENNLHEFISKRTTNRKFYSKASLPMEDKDALEKAGSGFGVGFLVQDNRESISHIASEASNNEQILFSNRLMHSFFFSKITWGKEEDLKKKGFYIKTLELPAPVRILFKMFRHWPVMRFLSILEIPKLIGKSNAAIYESSQALLAFVLKDYNPEGLIMTGRAMQNVWLEANSRGLNIQPITGILFLSNRIRKGNLNYLSNYHVKLIEKSYDKMKELFKVEEGKYISMILRVGRGDGPSARTLRHEPVFVSI